MDGQQVPVSRHETIDLVEQFGTADTVAVTDNVNRQLVVRTDRDALATLWLALGELADGWHVPPEGVPIAKLRLNFRRGHEPLGNLSLGADFLAAHVDGTFLARDSDPGTRQRLLDAVGAGHLLADR
jgi:hypothetical protein